MVQFIKDREIQSVVDAACGDFQSSYLIYDQLPDVQYDGYDIVKRVIESNRVTHTKYRFHHLDIVSQVDQLKSSDLIILKDVLQHLNPQQMTHILDYLVSSKKYKYILLCNCCNQTCDYELDTVTDRPLSCRFFPLKKYNPEVVYTYHTKEVSVIFLSKE